MLRQLVHRLVNLSLEPGHLGEGAQLQKDLEEGMLVGFVNTAGCLDQVRGNAESALQDILVLAIQEV